MKYGNLVDGTPVPAPYAVKVNGVTKATDTLTKAEANALGYKLFHLEMPSEPAGDKKHWEASGYEETDTDITRLWTAVDDPFVPRKFSKLRLYGAIISLPDSNGTSAWDKIKTWLEGKTIEGVNGWMAFQLAQEISEDHPLFAVLADEARQLLGLTQEQFDTLLAACILQD